VEHLLSAFTTAVGSWTLAEDADGDHAWLLQPSAAAASAGDAADALACGSALADGRVAFPASWDNLMTMKNLIQEADPGAKNHIYILVTTIYILVTLCIYTLCLFHFS
jgi:hypothetical protein